MNSGMDHSVSNYFFIALLSVAIVLAVLIFLPFLSPLVFAVALAVIFSPLHHWILRKFFGDREGSSWAALATLVLMVVLVFVPLTLFSVKAYSEIKGMYTFLLDEGGRAQAVNGLNSAAATVSSFFGMKEAYTFDSLNAVVILQKLSEWAFSHINTIFAEASKLAISLFVMFLALFYFLRDGRDLKRQLVVLSPLVDADDEHIFSKLEQAVRSIFAGSLAVGVLEGLQTGLSFAAFGVPSPALWGAAAVVAALVPGIGMPVVLGGGVIILFVMGMKAYAIGLLIWGSVAIAVIDNFIGPMLMHRGIKIHVFLILLSVLGGIIFFGPIGIVLGPLILAFLFSLLEIHKSGKHAQKPVGTQAMR